MAEELPDNQQDISKVPKQLQPHVFKRGQSGNPAGRPPTKTLKEFARDYLAGMTDDERIEYFEGIDKHKIWEMAEGKAPQSVDHTTKGDKIVFLPPELLNKNGISNTNSSAKPDSQ